MLPQDPREAMIIDDLSFIGHLGTPPSLHFVEGQPHIRQKTPPGHHQPPGCGKIQDPVLHDVKLTCLRKIHVKTLIIFDGGSVLPEGPVFFTRSSVVY